MNGTVDLTIIHLALASLLVAAAMYDLTALRIPNAIPLAIVAVFGVAWTVGLVRPMLPHLLSFLIASTVGVSLFGTHIWGGGDTKLTAALALFLVPAELAHFFLVTALAGGLVAATFVIHRQWSGLQKIACTSIPYGLALAVGGLDWCLLS